MRSDGRVCVPFAVLYSGGREKPTRFARSATLRAVTAGSCAPCAGGREGRAACAWRCGDVMCATGPWKVCDVCWRMEVVLYALEMLEGMRRVLLCMLEAVESEVCLLEGAGGDSLCAAL